MKDEFLWFPHMWSHMEPTRQEKVKLCDYMSKNKEFQEKLRNRIRISANEKVDAFLIKSKMKSYFVQ